MLTYAFFLSIWYLYRLFLGESPFLRQKWQLTLPARRNQLRAYFALSNDWQHHCLHWRYISGTISENPTSNIGCLTVSVTFGLFLFSLLCWSLWRNHELYVVYQSCSLGERRPPSRSCLLPMRTVVWIKGRWMHLLLRWSMARLSLECAVRWFLGIPIMPGWPIEWWRKRTRQMCAHCPMVS